MKVAIIGAGLIGKEHLRALQPVGGARVQAICDRSPVMAEAAADRFGVPRWYTDTGRMIQEVGPDVVHITTPAPTHSALAAQALESGCHVLVEKPITANLEELDRLVKLAHRRTRWLIEDHNYLWNSAVQQILADVTSGRMGDVVHVDVVLALNLFSEGSRFADRNDPHPALRTAAGAVSDFVTHLAYLAHALVGAHRSVRTVWQPHPRPEAAGCHEFRSLVDAERGTAHLSFSARTQPDTFTLRVHGTRMTAATNLFETTSTHSIVRGGPRPLVPLRNGFGRAVEESRGAVGSIVRKLGGGPGALEGLWELIRQMYNALEEGNAPPVPIRHVLEVNRLVQALSAEEEVACVS